MSKAKPKRFLAQSANETDLETLDIYREFFYVCSDKLGPAIEQWREYAQNKPYLKKKNHINVLLKECQKLDTDLAEMTNKYNKAVALLHRCRTVDKKACNRK